MKKERMPTKRYQNQIMQEYAEGWNWEYEEYAEGLKGTKRSVGCDSNRSG